MVVAQGWPIVGRDRERAAALAALDAPVGGVLLLGDEGFGKSTLAGLIAEVLEARTQSVAWVAGTRLSASAPLGALEPWLGDRAPDTAPQSAAVAELSAPLAGRRDGTVVIVDDAQWVDPASRDVLFELADRGTVRLVVALDAEQPDALLAKLEQINVEPLTRSDVHRVLTGALGGNVSPELLHAAWERSRGVPRVLREFVTIGLGCRAIVRHGAQLAFDAGVFAEHAVASGALIGQTFTTEPELTPLLAITAIAEPVPVRLIADVVEPSVLARAEDLHLIQRLPLGGEDHVRFENPVYGEAVRARLGPIERRRAASALGAAIGDRASLSARDRVRLARWTIAADAPLPVDDAIAAARSAISCGDLDLALRCARAAWGQRPDAESALVLGIVQNYRGNLDEAATALTFAHEAATDPMQRADVLIHRLPSLGLDTDTAVESVQHALSEVHDDTWRAMLADRAAWTCVALGYPTAAVRLIEPFVAQPDLDPVARDELTSPLTAARLLVGELDLVDRQLDELDPDRARGSPQGWLTWVPLQRTYAALAAVQRGDAEGGLAIAEQEYGAPGYEVVLEVRAWSSCAAGQACLSLGRFADAVAWFRMSLNVPASRALRERFAAVGLLEAATLAGDASNVTAASGLLRRMPAGAEHVTVGRLARMKAIRAAANGVGLADAVADLRHAADVLRRFDLGSLEIEVRHELTLLDQCEPEAIRELERLAARIGGPLPALLVRHALAVAARDLAAVERATDDFEALGAPWLAARCAGAGAATAAHVHEMSRARRLSRRAQHLATALAIAPELRPPSIELSLLTERERQIARRAAQRIPARDIALELGIATRSVENALSRVYSKLGVASRQELSAVIGVG
jgi:DNA-binding CsgD family transcriptional regulator